MKRSVEIVVMHVLEMVAAVAMVVTMICAAALAVDLAWRLTR